MGAAPGDILPGGHFIQVRLKLSKLFDWLHNMRVHFSSDPTPSRKICCWMSERFPIHAVDGLFETKGIPTEE
jgi:hypothetical protein